MRCLVPDIGASRRRREPVAQRAQCGQSVLRKAWTASHCCHGTPGQHCIGARSRKGRHELRGPASGPSVYARGMARLVDVVHPRTRVAIRTALIGPHEDSPSQRHVCLIEDGGGVAGFRSVSGCSVSWLDNCLSPAGWLSIDRLLVGCPGRGVARKRRAGSPESGVPAAVLPTASRRNHECDDWDRSA